ncbi:MAG: glycosyltransferase family 1 protein [Anaerolineaceae bacterium]|nr:glycosyltransferase family 1 protein [Anaerolineaceae bacterium]
MRGFVSMPIITIDYTSAVHQRAGIGRFTRELIHALAETAGDYHFRLFVAGRAKNQSLSLPGSQFSWRNTRIPARYLTRIWHRLRMPLPVELLSGKADLFHAPDFSLPPTLPGTRRLLMVHDLSFEKVPETFTPWLLRYLRQVVPRALHRADHIIANSFSTRNDYVEHFALDERKFTVIHGGISPKFHTQQRVSTKPMDPEPGPPFVLAVGTLQPRKNYPRLIEAVSRLRAKGSELELVIVGGPGWLGEEIYETRERLGMQAAVHLRGYVAEEELPALYRRARIFAYPSLYEGFGFPLLEAMACGTPTLTAAVSSLPEIAQDAAFYIDPYDVEAIEEGLRRLHEDEALRQELIAKGYERVQQFSWQKAAKTLLKVYDRMLNEG